ncbi:MAG: cyclin-domain-containing protein [Benjaminiella poitrasii]|nr:MAG: cyclin-domain-containing protein [Benjaminiella poitrasii]
MTSLLPIQQYVTLHTRANISNSSSTTTTTTATSTSSVANVSLKYDYHKPTARITEPEIYKLHRPVAERGVGGGERMPIVTAVKSKTPFVSTNHHSNRLAYVDALVDANALVIESIWELTSNDNSANHNSNVVPLRTFIQEVLKRSRTTYSTLQTALFYLFRSKQDIQLHLAKMQQPNMTSRWEDAYISCGRRMFLASLVIASKFVQDKTYRNSAWAKIAGLSVQEVNAAERIFLNMIDYQLYISQPTFEKWHHILHAHVESRTHLLSPPSLEDSWTLVLSRPPFSLPPSPPSPSENKRKRSYPSPPPLSTSSSSNSSPMQTPKMNCNSSKKRKIISVENNVTYLRSSYNISHVRQQPAIEKRFHCS